MKQTPTDGVTWTTMAGPIANAAVSPVERSTGLCVASTRNSTIEVLSYTTCGVIARCHMGAVHPVGSFGSSAQPRHSPPILKLIDFGLAAESGFAEKEFAGSAHYAAPEQILGDLTGDGPLTLRTRSKGQDGAGGSIGGGGGYGTMGAGGAGGCGGATKGIDRVHGDVFEVK